MSKFDTQGGYFAPTGYMRVNEGGKHDENPYGGVQIGVDPEGVPNLLEEGEPVYKDFVFSDNINADKEFLEQAGIPLKYTGKLYSEIADAYLEEAEMNPLDQISANGLNAMLGRLAEAQEAQKAAEEQRKIEEELANMSPEELAMLEQMLMQQQAQEQQQVAQQQEMMQQQMMQDPAMQQEMMMQQQQPDVSGMVDPSMMMEEQPQMMKCGGKLKACGGKLKACGGRINRFDDGGYGYIQPAVVTANSPVTQAIYDGQRRFLSNAKGVYDAAKQPLMFVPGIGDAIMAEDFVSSLIGDVADSYAGTGGTDMSLGFSAARRRKKKTPKLKKTWKNLSKGKKAGILFFPAAAALTGASLLYDNIWGFNKNAGADPSSDGEYDIDPNDFAYGGRVNRFDRAGGMFRVGNMTTDPTVAWDRYARLGVLDYFRDYANRYATAESVEDKIRIRRELMNAVNAHQNLYKNAYVNFNGENSPYSEDTIALQRSWDEKGGNSYFGGIDDDINIVGTTSDKANGSFSPDGYFGWRTRLRNFGTDEYGDQEEILQLANSMGLNWDPTLEYGDGANRLYLLSEMENSENGGSSIIDDLIAKLPPADLSLPDPQLPDFERSYAVRPDERKPLSTLPRYAGVLGSAGLAASTLFQQPDHYEHTPVNPVLPYGDIHLQNERYMPIDMNMLYNQMEAQIAANRRAIGNAGLGPSVGATLLSSGYNGNQAIGSALVNGWASNNQERNRVITANNQNEKTRADFYRNLDSERTQILNNFASKNKEDALRIQMMNNQAEQDKYNAFSQNLDNMFSGLAKIGQENFAMNQANSNRALRYLTNWNGWSDYKDPKDQDYKCGGTLLRNPKKKK